MDDRARIADRQGDRCRAAIVGAGVGGLAAAIGLGKVGCLPTVFERSNAVRAGGGALWIFPNGVHALRSLGLGHELQTFATPVDEYRFWSWTGRKLWSMPVDRFPAMYGAPLVIVERGRLLEVLLRSASHCSDIRVESDCLGFETRRSQVAPVLAGSSSQPTRDYDVLIGADGFGSSIRAQLFGEPDVVPLQMAWTGTAVLDSSEWFCRAGEMASFHGQGLLFTVSTARPRKDDPAGALRVLWFASERISTERARLTHGELAAQFGRVDARIGRLIERSPDPVAYPVRDRDPLSRWGRGRVTLLGDAAHPMTPDLGQGACQALEDAVTLAEVFRDARRRARGSRDLELDVERALDLYQTRRTARAGRVVRMSRLMSMSRLVMGTTWDPVRNFLTSAGMPSFLMHELRFVLGGEPVPWLFPGSLSL